MWTLHYLTLNLGCRWLFP
uniref:Uncharacterized protein n=1 Tax=Arundo donax TaxID=35708 RepID=A0A0A9APA9_ARUDO